MREETNMKTVTKQFTNVQDGIKNLIKAANADYCDRSYKSEDAVPNHVLEMQEQFKNGWTIKDGKKYIGIYKTLGNQQSIWGGVVKEDSANGLLKKGDILKAAGYGAQRVRHRKQADMDGPGGCTLRAARCARSRADMH